MARRELRQPHLAPLKPHMPAGARIRESDGNPHCRQNPSITSLAYPHAGHDTHRNTAARQTQPGAHPPIARSGTPRRTPSNLNISAIPRDRRDFRIRRILPISAPTPVIKNRGIPTIPMGDHLVRNRIALDSRTSRGSSDTGPGIRRILPQVQSTDLPCVGVVGHGELAPMSSLAAGNAAESTA
jgi:hypothetical protein